MDIDGENITKIEYNISNVPEVQPYITEENCCASVYYLHHHHHHHYHYYGNFSSEDFNATVRALFRAFINASSSSSMQLIQDKDMKNIELTMMSTSLLLVMLCVMIIYYVKKHVSSFRCVQRLQELREQWRLQEVPGQKPRRRGQV